MAAFNFPSSPSNGQSYTANGVTWTYSSSSGAWIRSSAVGAQGAAGSDATISNNADNRVITGGSGTNLNGEANLTFDGSLLTTAGNGKFNKTGNCNVLIGSTNAGGAAIVIDGDSDGNGSGADYAYIEHDTSGNLNIVATNPADSSSMIFNTGDGSEALRITSSGNLETRKPPLNTATITTTNCLQLGLRIGTDGTGSNTEGHIYNGLAVGDGYAGLYGKDGGSGAATDLEFFTGTASAVAGRMRIRDDGKIIIGGNVSQSINRSVVVVAASGNSQAVEIGLQPTNSSGGYNPEVYISSVADGTYGAQIGFHTRNTSGDRAERFGISSSGNIKWRNGAVLQRKTSSYLSIASAGTSDVKISGNFENNDMLRVRWAYNWNAGDGGAWGEAVIWKQYQGTVRVRYLTDVKASPLTSVSFPHSGNDIWLRWQTNAGINGYYMIDVEGAGCEPFPF